MPEQCRGITKKGLRCRLTGTPYCRYHVSQGHHVEECQQEEMPEGELVSPKEEMPSHQKGELLTFAPVQESPYQASPEIRQLTEEQEGLEGATFYLEDLLDIPVEEYRDLAYDQLYSVVGFLGFDSRNLPSFHEETEDNREYLLSLIESYYRGDLDEDLLSPEGLTNYRYAQEYLHGHKKQEETHRQEQQERGATCCICLDENVPEGKLLPCRHPVCSPCLKQLTKAECPMCRQGIPEHLLDPNLRAEMERKEEAAKETEESLNYIIALLLEENPNVDPADLYSIYTSAR